MSDFVLLGTPRKRREAIVARLKGLGIQSGELSVSLQQETDLGHHLTQRIWFTAMKLQVLHALKFAERDDSAALQVGGAIAQDRSGDAHRVSDGTSSFLKGTQAAHLAIGTFTRNGEAISKVGERFLAANAATPAEKSDRFSAYSLLVGMSMRFDGMTELLPAFVNQSFGVIERTSIEYLKGILSSFYAVQDEHRLERFLEGDVDRIFDFFTEKRQTLLRPVNDRLNMLKADMTKSFNQSPTDARSLVLFEGKEFVFLQAVVNELTSEHSDFRSKIRDTHNVAMDNCRAFCDLAVRARAERDSVSDR